MGRSKVQKRKRGKRGHGKAKQSGEGDDGARMSGRERQDLVEERRQQKKAMKKTASKYSMEQLIEKAEEYMDTYEYKMAQKFCQRALQLDPDNVKALETSGNLLAELGDADGAKRCFGRAITVCPEEGYSKYMYMGQLHEGLEAVQFFQKGVELMMKKRDQKQKEVQGASCSSGIEHQSVSNQDVSSAYCSIAEIYLTDSCFEDDSEHQCKTALDRAVSEDPNSSEAHQLMASYWLSKDDRVQSKASIEKSMSLWQQPQTDSGGDMVGHMVTAPALSYENRIAAAKILMELEMFDTAEGVLHSLLEEDDEVVQVWYMLGLVQYERKTDECKAPARYYLHNVKKLYCSLDCDDEPILQHTEELLASLGPGEGDDEGWMQMKAKEEEEEVDEDDDVDSEASSDEEDMEH